MSDTVDQNRALYSSKAVYETDVVRVESGGAMSREDRLAVEEPLEIRVAGDTVGVTMRTPGDDHNLALGFLFSEGIVRSADEVGSLAHCGRPGDGFGNVIEMKPAPGVVLDPEARARARRGTLTSAACGVCGRQSIDDLLADIREVPAGEAIDMNMVRACVGSLRGAQPVFDATGGLHGAAAFDAHGNMLASAEDIGRHNAVDKVCGALLKATQSAALLVVSGRLGFEIVQKAACSRIGVLASVSAASSLATQLAERANICAIGFVRGETANVYSHSERVGLP